MSTPWQQMAANNPPPQQQPQPQPYPYPPQNSGQPFPMPPMGGQMAPPPYAQNRGPAPQINWSEHSETTGSPANNPNFHTHDFTTRGLFVWTGAWVGVTFFASAIFWIFLVVQFFDTVSVVLQSFGRGHVAPVVFQVVRFIARLII